METNPIVIYIKENLHAVVGSVTKEAMMDEQIAFDCCDEDTMLGGNTFAVTPGLARSRITF